jgi:hypothetical protein
MEFKDKSEVHIETGYVNNVRFEVPAAVTMKIAIFWDVMPLGSCKKLCFRGTYYLHYQDEKNQHTSYC